MPNAPKKSVKTASRVAHMNNNTRKNLVRMSNNVKFELEPNEEVEVVNFNTNWTPEPSKAALAAGIVTPQRPTRSVFGAVGALPSAAPGAPRKLYRRTRRTRRAHTRR